MGDLVRREDILQQFAYSAPELFADREWFAMMVGKIPSAGEIHRPNHGYMWICPKCDIHVHSDYTECLHCGYIRNE